MAKLRGEKLMVFIADNSGETTTYKSIAYATTHSFSIGTSTSSNANKDEGGSWENADVETLNWSISSDNLVASDGSNFSTIFDIMVGKDPVDLYFTLKTETADTLPEGQDSWTPVTTGNCVYKGKAIVSDLSLQADSGAVSTMSVTFTGYGELSHVK